MNVKSYYCYIGSKQKLIGQDSILATRINAIIDDSRIYVPAISMEQLEERISIFEKKMIGQFESKRLVYHLVFWYEKISYESVHNHLVVEIWFD